MHCASVQAHSSGMAVRQAEVVPQDDPDEWDCMYVVIEFDGRYCASWGLFRTAKLAQDLYRFTPPTRESLGTVKVSTCLLMTPYASKYSVLLGLIICL